MSDAEGLLAGAAVLALLALAGAAPWRALGGERAPRAVALAGSLAAGAALWGLTGFALNLAGAPLAAWQLAALALLSLAAGRVLARRVAPRWAHAPPPPARADLALRLARALLVPVLLLGALATVGLPFRGDGGKFWLPKARDTLAAGVARTPALQDPAHLGFHRNYPLLGPALLAPAVDLAPADAHTAPKLVLAGLHAALLVLLLHRLSRAGPAGGALALLAVAMPVWILPDPAASPGAGGLLDGVLALFLLLFVDAADGLRRGRPGAAARAALWGAALACTKLEGGVAAALVAGAALLAGPARAGWRGVLPAALATGALLALFAAAVPSSPPIARPALLLDPDNLAVRLPVLLTGLAGLALDVERFGLLPLALLAAGLSPAGRRAGFAWCLALGVALFLAAVYLGTTMHLGRHLETSAHRLALQWLPAFALLAARALGDGAQGGGARQGDTAHGASAPPSAEGA